MKKIVSISYVRPTKGKDGKEPSANWRGWLTMNLDQPIGKMMNRSEEVVDTNSLQVSLLMKDNELAVERAKSEFAFLHGIKCNLTDEQLGIIGEYVKERKDKLLKLYSNQRKTRDTYKGESEIAL